ncbi:hypothetical protein [Flavobacterium sp. 140616W15]|uniref:hypothetical protein n=1 Tax=Flavobacterium sp. 140616W15 TaxID=2478552 RepID=UPI000F0CEB41|nr:hypothetical protein [Flavobacterium sp. 140616W15]AYN05786.1 hypothetical protein EAG11_17730 [Flavobacterium sp. 140616W15]
MIFFAITFTPRKNTLAMNKNAIHNFNLSIKNSTAINSSEDLTEAVIKELAKVSKEMSQQKDIVQVWQEQNALNTTITNNSSVLPEGGAIDTSIETIRKTGLSESTISSVFEGSIANHNALTSIISSEKTGTPNALIGGGVAETNGRTIVSSTVSGNTTPPIIGADNNTLNFSNGLTTQTYASVATQQTLTVPQMLQENSSEPTIEVVKAGIKKRLDLAITANNSVEIKYWRGISNAFDEGATAQDFDGKKDQERFTEMYFGLQKWRLATIDETTINNVNWGEVSESMIFKLSQLSKEEKEDRLIRYYNKLIKEIRNPAINIPQLFSEHDELFLLLKSIFPHLPAKIAIQTQKGSYPDLSPQKMYPDLGVKNMYFIWSETQLDEVVIKNGKGEILKDENGQYRDLKNGQWYDYDRIENPTKVGSTFWKASLYNTINEQHYLYHTIGQRHAYYQFADAYLKTKGIISEWFDAAARVTMGSIKEALQGEIALQSAEMVNFWYLSDKTDEFLKEGNRNLFSDNMNNVKLLLEGKGKLSGEFIDAKGNKQSFKNLSKQELDYKLVEFEQSLVQEYINFSFKDLNNSFIKKSLDEVSSTTGNKEFDAIIKEINENFTHWMAPDIMQDIMEKYFMTKGKLTFNFAKYDDRVKLGQLMVKELYYLRLSDTFKVDSIDKILKNPVQNSTKTREYFIIDQKHAVKEKDKHIKEYKFLERLERIKKKLNDKSAHSDEVSKIKKDLVNASVEEIKKSLVNIKKEIKNSLVNIGNEVENSALAIEKIVYNDLRAFYDEIKKEFEITSTTGFEDKEYADLIKNFYKDLIEIYEISEKLRAKLPEERDKIINSIAEEAKKMPDEIAVNALLRAAESYYPGVKTLEDGEKEELFKNNYKASVAILLYEFATGTGPEIRNFDYHVHKFAQAILQDRMIDEIMEETLKLLQQTNYDFVNKPDSKDLKVDLELSPTPVFVIESFDKHLNSNLAQIFIGGAFALVRIKNKKLEGYIYNKTSRESLMLHLNVGNRKRKNDRADEKILSTIIQRIYFTFKLP